MFPTDQQTCFLNDLQQYPQAITRWNENEKELFATLTLVRQKLPFPIFYAGFTSAFDICFAYKLDGYVFLRKNECDNSVICETQTNSEPGTYIIPSPPCFLSVNFKRLVAFCDQRNLIVNSLFESEPFDKIKVKIVQNEHDEIEDFTCNEDGRLFFLTNTDQVISATINESFKITTTIFSERKKSFFEKIKSISFSKKSTNLQNGRFFKIRTFQKKKQKYVAIQIGAIFSIFPENSDKENRQKSDVIQLDELTKKNILKIYKNQKLETNQIIFMDFFIEECDNEDSVLVYFVYCVLLSDAFGKKESSIFIEKLKIEEKVTTFENLLLLHTCNNHSCQNSKANIQNCGKTIFVSINKSSTDNQEQKNLIFKISKSNLSSTQRDFNEKIVGLGAFFFRSDENAIIIFENKISFWDPKKQKIDLLSVKNYSKISETFQTRKSLKNQSFVEAFSSLISKNSDSFSLNDSHFLNKLNLLVLRISSAEKTIAIFEEILAKKSKAMNFAGKLKPEDLSKIEDYSKIASSFNENSSFVSTSILPVDDIVTGQLLRTKFEIQKVFDICMCQQVENFEKVESKYREIKFLLKLGLILRQFQKKMSKNNNSKEFVDSILKATCSEIFTDFLEIYNQDIFYSNVENFPLFFHYSNQIKIQNCSQKIIYTEMRMLLSNVLDLIKKTRSKGSSESSQNFTQFLIETKLLNNFGIFFKDNFSIFEDSNSINFFDENEIFLRSLLCEISAQGSQYNNSNTFFKELSESIYQLIESYRSPSDSFCTAFKQDNKVNGSGKFVSCLFFIRHPPQLNSICAHFGRKRIGTNHRRRQGKVGF